MYRETNVSNSSAKFLFYIFTLTRWLGVFPFHWKSTTPESHHVKCKSAILYSLLPLVLTIANVIFLLQHRFDSYYGHYFVIIIEILTHVNILVYVIVSYVHCETICEALDGCIHVSKIITKWNYYPYGVIISLFVVWNFFCLLQLKDTTYATISLIPLYAEKFIIGLLETQLCLLLYVIKMAAAQINGDIAEEVFRREADNVQLYDVKWRFSKTDTRLSGFLQTEHYRRLHLKIFITMEGLNKSYGLGNLVLTIRERLSFAFYLYFWITRNHIFDLILASINFLKVGMIFYCFQKLKNEETELKSSVNELLSHYSNTEERRKFYIFSKQVHALEIKFDACGMFSMDFDTVFSIFTTTAGYLLLLSQLRL